MNEVEIKKLKKCGCTICKRHLVIHEIINKFGDDKIWGKLWDIITDLEEIEFDLAGIYSEEDGRYYSKEELINFFGISKEKIKECDLIRMGKMNEKSMDIMGIMDVERLHTGISKIIEEKNND